MAIFITVLDDDPADRKQAERLLSRERDERAKRGEVIYYDAYGSEDALLPFFMKYDMFLIDVTRTTRDGMMIAMDLKNRNAGGLIVLCYDKIDYRSKYGDEEGISFIQKPLWQKDYARLIDMAGSVHKNKAPKIELRGDRDTLYVTMDEVLYATDGGYYSAVALSGNRSFHALTDLKTLSDSLDPGRFMMLSGRSLINMDHVVSVAGSGFKMADGAIIRFGLLEKRSVTKKYEIFARKKSVQKETMIPPSDA